VSQVARKNGGKGHVMKKSTIKEIEALVSKDEKDIDISDISETTNWDSGVTGKFYRPIERVRQEGQATQVIDSG
jgi:hypothetical protein